MKEPTNEVDKNGFAVVFTNSHCTEEVVGHVQILLNFSFYGPVYKFLTINVFYRLLLGKSAIERSGIGSNVNKGLEMMSAIQRCPL